MSREVNNVSKILLIICIFLNVIFYSNQIYNKIQREVEKVQIYFNICDDFK